MVNNKAKILVVEDDPLIRNGMHRTLTAAGYTVIVASDGMEGMNQVYANLPDLILLDVNMPRMGGFEVLRRVKNDPNLTSIFIVIVSSSRIDVDSQVYGLETGADGYLVRPITNRELLAHVRSILRIKAAEDAVREKEKQLRELITNNVDGMLVVDREGKTLFANPAALVLLDRSLETVTGEEIGIPVVSADYTEMDVLRPDGRLRTVEMRVGEIVWNSQPAFLAAMRDITERRQTEAALAEAERLRSLILESVEEGIHGLDKEGRIVFANSSSLEMLGWDFSEMEGHHAHPLLHHHRADGSPYPVEACPIHATLRDGVSRHVDDELLFRKDGTSFIVEYICSAMKDANGTITGAVVSFRDVSEQKLAEKLREEYKARLESEVQERTRQMEEMQDQLLRQERLAVLGQMAGGVGHELRNPLGVISNAVYFLRLVQSDAGPKIQEYLETIDSEVKNAGKIVSDLLDFSRPHLADRDLTAIPEVVERALQRLFLPGNVALDLEMEEGLPQVRVDAHQLGQILNNLLTNACQAMPDGGTLRVRVVAIGDWLMIRVEDTGVGVSKENLAKLFEPLFTTKPRGIGLGLALSQKLAVANNGYITVQSVLHEGATFTVYLRIEDGGAVQKPQQS